MVYAPCNYAKHVLDVECHRIDLAKYLFWVATKRGTSPRRPFFQFWIDKCIAAIQQPSHRRISTLESVHWKKPWRPRLSTREHTHTKAHAPMSRNWDGLVVIAFCVYASTSWYHLARLTLEKKTIYRVNILFNIGTRYCLIGHTSELDLDGNQSLVRLDHILRLVGLRNGFNMPIVC